jgi:hypothetical protein
MSFTYKTIDEKKLSDGSKERTLQVYKTNKTPMTRKEIVDVANTIKSKLASQGKFMILAHRDAIKDDNVQIRGLNPAGWATLKTFKKDLNYKNDEDFINTSNDLGTARNDKQYKFYQLQITLSKPY